MVYNGLDKSYYNLLIENHLNKDIVNSIVHRTAKYDKPTVLQKIVVWASFQ